MRLYIIFRHIGSILLLNAIFMFLALIIAIFHNDSGIFPLLYSTIITGLFGIFPWLFVPHSSSLQFNESFTIVVFGWVITCMAGTLPFILWGGDFTFFNAWFESVSGFTTTGSTILRDIESLPRSLLFWRSSTHFIGGIGVIVFVLFVIPSANQTRLLLYNSEISSMAKNNYHYRTKQTLQILLYVYFGLTILETIFLFIAGMDLFDAINHAFSTIATGGFSTKNISIAHYDNLAIEIIIMFFMALAGVHFGLIFATITKKSPNIFNSVIVRFYLLSLFAGILFVTIKLSFSGQYESWHEALRYASFQVISLGTSVGFATANTTVWPSFIILVLVYFSIQCACAGSTTGGIKVDRLVILWKSIMNQIKYLQHPRAIFTIKINKKPISQDIIQNSANYIALYLLILFISTLILSIFNYDLLTTFSASVATLGNVGPGFGAVGSMDNYYFFPDGAKFLMSINMLMGRLEISGFIALFMLKSWQ